jgi:hypothetical protein
MDRPDAFAEVKRGGVRMIAEISETELAIRICEAGYGMHRPPGMTAEQALDGLDPAVRETMCRSAQAAIQYWRECIESMKQVN